MMLLSIMPSAPSASNYFISGLISILMVLCVWRVSKKPHYLNNNTVLFALLLCLLHYIFPMGGSDFYSYKDWVESTGYTNISSIPMYYLHFEKPYYIILNIIHNNYFLFRLIVWGGSLFLFWQTARRLEMDKSTFTFYLCICIVQLTAVSRVCLAYALAYFGFSFLAKPMRKNNYILSYILGISFILISMFFHRSALFLLAILPLSLVNFNKKTIWIFALMVPTVIVAAYSNLLDYIFNFEQSDTSLLDSETAMYYLDSSKKRVFGVAQRIEFTMKYGSHVLMILFIVKSILNNAYKSWPHCVQKYANATLLITVLSAALLLTPGATTYKTFERFIAFAYVPQSIFMAYILKIDFDKKIVSAINLLIAGYVSFAALYYNIYFGFIDF